MTSPFSLHSTLHLNDLREQIQLYALKKIPDERGGWTEKWEAGLRIWARITPLALRQGSQGSAKAKRLNSAERDPPTYHLTVRASLPLEKNARLVWRHHFYSVLSEPMISLDQTAKEALISLLLPSESEAFPDKKVLET